MIQNEMLINGEWVKSSNGEYIEIENPATEQMFERVPVSSPTDIRHPVTV